MKSVIVIGGSGYIGSEICNQLLDKDYFVLNIDKLHSPVNERNHKYFRELIINLQYYDRQKDYADIEEELNGNDVKGVICLAAYKDLEESLYHPSAYYRNNLMCLLNALEIANQVRSKSFIFSSSAAVYDDSNTLECKEYFTPEIGGTPYGYTKLIGERIVGDVCQEYGIKGISLRYFNPVGRTKYSVDDSTSLFGNILKCIRNHQVAEIYGDKYDSIDGTCIRDYVDIRDVADAHIFMIEHHDSLPNGDIYNIGRGVQITVLDVMKAVKSIVPEFEYKISEPRFGDVVGSFANIDGIRNLGWTPKYTLNDSIKTLLD